MRIGFTDLSQKLQTVRGELPKISDDAITGRFLRAFRKIRRLIETDPLSKEAHVLAALVTALERGSAFAVKDLYTFDEKQGV